MPKITLEELARMVQKGFRAMEKRAGALEGRIAIAEVKISAIENEIKVIRFLMGNLVKKEERMGLEQRTRKLEVSVAVR